MSSKAFIGPEDGFMWRRQVELQAKTNPTNAPEQLGESLRSLNTRRYYSNDAEQVAKQMLERPAADERSVTSGVGAVETLG